VRAGPAEPFVLHRAILLCVAPDGSPDARLRVAGERGSVYLVAGSAGADQSDGATAAMVSESPDLDLYAFGGDGRAQGRGGGARVDTRAEQAPPPQPAPRPAFERGGGGCAAVITRKPGLAGKPGEGSPGYERDRRAQLLPGIAMPGLQGRLGFQGAPGLRALPWLALVLICVFGRVYGRRPAGRRVLPRDPPRFG
jgi:hypothetical protein